LTVAADITTDENLVSEIIERFHQEHQRTYGRRASDEPVDLITIRSTFRMEVDRVIPHSVNVSQDRQRPREAYFGKEQGSIMTQVISREELTSTFRSGPLIIEEYDSTTLVPVGTEARVDELGNIIMVNKGLEVNRD
jgi:N-methylhydantoinase A